MYLELACGSTIVVVSWALCLRLSWDDAEVNAALTSSGVGGADGGQVFSKIESALYIQYNILDTRPLDQAKKPLQGLLSTTKLTRLVPSLSIGSSRICNFAPLGTLDPKAS